MLATALAFVCGEAEPTGRGVMVMAPTEGFKGLSGPTKIYNNSHAVVIGINQYSHVRELNGAVRDGKAVAVALRERGFDVKELYDDSATREQIIGELAERLPGKLGAEDRVLVYFAGHGVSTGTGTNLIGYLLPVGGHSDKPISTGISMRELQVWLGGYKSKHVLFVADACYSGLALSTRSVPRSSTQSDYLKLVTRDRVRLTLVAGSDGEEAIEENGEGLFTRFFLEALNGAADYDNDGVTTGDEISAYVKPKVTNAAHTLLGRSQRPQVARSGMGEFIFLTRGKSLSLGPNYLAMRKLPDEVDRANPLDMAGAILAAYRTRDFITLAEFSPEHNREIFAELAREGSSHGRYRSIFTGWRWKVVSAWDGMLREVRYRGSKAEVLFNDLGGDEVAVVVLEWSGEKQIWDWEDIHSPDRLSFERNSLTPPVGLPVPR